MRKLIDPEVMRHCEAAYFRASSVASIDVMEVAARALANAALERFPEARRVFVACGPGGNGGDGYACARMLRDAGLDVRVYPAAPAKSPDAIANAARVRELIRDAESEGSRTPVDSGAGCAPGTPNDMPTGIQTPSSADAQHTDTKANRAQFCKRSPADPAANKGIRIPDSTPARIHPSIADAHPADAEASQAQFSEISSANSTANDGFRISNDAPMLQSPGMEAQSADAGMPLGYASGKSSTDVETPLTQACEQPFANSSTNDGIRIPDSTPAKLPPSGADAQPADADAPQTQFGAESSAAAEAPLAQACEQSSANSTANDGIRIPDSASAKIHPSIADAQPADTEASQAQFSEISSANSTSDEGIRIPNDAPMKLQSHGMEAQSADAGMPLGYANGKSSTNVETPLAQACERSFANSTASDGIRTPDSTPAKAHPSGADAQPADAETNRAQFGAESSAAAEAPLAQAFERSSADSTANDSIRIPNSAPAKLHPSTVNAQPADADSPRAQFGTESPADCTANDSIRIPNSTPAKLHPSGADAQPADVETIQASFGAESPAGSIANGLIHIPYGTPAKLPPSGADAQPADGETNRAQFGAESSSAAEAPLAQACKRSSADSTANDGIRIPDSTPAKLHPSTANAHPSDANQTRTQDTSEACPASGHAAPCKPVDPVDIPDLWIDCLYGTGLSRAPSGVAAELIARMKRDRAAGAKVLAADIPSGLNGATGARFEPCVEADCTVAFQFAKPGHLLGDGLDVCGELLVADVGFPEAAFPANLPAQIEPSDLRGMFAPRRRNIHKGSCGHLLIVAGSFGIAGAAALCARAALRSGVGLVSIACPASIVPILQGLVPCAMCVPLPEREGAISPEAVESLRAALRGKSAVVIGPGLSRRTAPEVVAAVLESGLPAAIDADALNLIAENPEMKSLLRPHHILTPHPGEAARLLGHPCTNPIADARELAALGAQGEMAGEHANVPTGARDEAANSLGRNAIDARSGDAGCPAICAAHAQSGAAGERTAGQLRAQDGTVGGRQEGAANHSGTVPIADAREFWEFAATGAESARAEAAGECAVDQSRARKDTDDERAVSLACEQGESAKVLNERAGIPADARAGAANQRVKFLASMQEKPADALNRWIGISANAQPGAPGECAATSADTHTEASNDCADLIADGCAEAQDVCTDTIAGIRAEALGDCADLIAGAHTEAPRNCSDLIADVHAEVPRSCANIVERRCAEALRGCSDLIADAHAETPSDCAELIADAHAEAPRGCSDTVAGARVNPTCAREDIPTDAGEAATFGPTAVLKGASRVVAGGGEVYVSTSGAPGMARGGSGDVYAGILGALLAEKSTRTPAQSAAAACELHGLAGELAQVKYGPRAMNSADLIEFLPDVFRRCVD